jgi:hypothetical protein
MQIDQLSDFENLCAFIILPMHTKYPSYFILLDLITEDMMDSTIYAAPQYEIFSNYL